MSAISNPDSDNREFPVIETPSVTVDIVIFTIQDNKLKVLLIKRKGEPYKDYWAIPGGFIRQGETLDAAALRELKEETGVGDVYLDQLYTFGGPERDPRKRVITVSYYSLVRPDRLENNPERDRNHVDWFCVKELPLLAFDHGNIITCAWDRLKEKLDHAALGFELLPQEFTLTELQRVYEIILDKELDKRNFRKRIISTNVVKSTDKTKMEGYHRPAKLYTLNTDTNNC